MIKNILTLILSFSLIISQAQVWDVTEIGQLPTAVANNAVTEGFVGSTPYLYSFGGIDATKTHGGIHLHSYRINTLTGLAETLADLPDTLGKVAAGASRINDTIYIIGGYHVFSNGNEVSSNKVHRFNVNTNSFIADGASIPTPIDDHVQAIWRDSLIYVITGWSNTTNVPKVQIYNPYTNLWAAGTSTTNSNNYKSFGASGTIIGDTIYYFGGASLGFNFPSQNQLRKGYINPNDPTDITWNYQVLDTQIKGYRMACTNIGNQIHWIGGSDVTYNYDGIAYNNSGGVNPNNRDLYLDTDKNLFWATNYTQDYPMDLRGIASVNDSLKYIAGGMLSNQIVTDKVYELKWHYTLTDIKKMNTNFTALVYPNPANKNSSITIETEGLLNNEGTVSLFNLNGQILHSTSLKPNKTTIEIPNLNSGIYYIEISTEQGKTTQKISIQ
jgi:hypothetical protein